MGVLLGRGSIFVPVPGIGLILKAVMFHVKHDQATDVLGPGGAGPCRGPGTDSRRSKRSTRDSMPDAPKRRCAMLELRPNCECCDKDLAPDAADALICTFECTFCADCVA